MLGPGFPFIFPAVRNECYWPCIKFPLFLWNKYAVVLNKGELYGQEVGYMLLSKYCSTLVTLTNWLNRLLVPGRTIAALLVCVLCDQSLCCLYAKKDQTSLYISVRVWTGMLLTLCMQLI